MEPAMPVTLGQFIGSRRRALGLTQEDLAERIGGGVQQSEVSRLETDRVLLPRRLRLEQIARALEVPLGELLLRSGWVGAEAIESRSDDALAMDELRLRNAQLEAQSEQHQAETDRLEAQAELRTSDIATLEHLVLQFRAVLNGITVAVVVVNPAGLVVLENTAYAVFEATWSDMPAMVDLGGIPIAEPNTPLVRAARGERFTMTFMIAGADGTFQADGEPVLADGGGLLGVVTFRDAAPGDGSALTS
jgi:transcriptional regulator with XRE-family HTH domain